MQRWGEGRGVMIRLETKRGRKEGRKGKEKEGRKGKEKEKMRKGLKSALLEI